MSCNMEFIFVYFPQLGCCLGSRPALDVRLSFSHTMSLRLTFSHTPSLRLKCRRHTSPDFHLFQLLLPLGVDGVAFNSKWPKNQLSKFGVFPSPPWGIADLGGQPRMAGVRWDVYRRRETPRRQGCQEIGRILWMTLNVFSVSVTVRFRYSGFPLAQYGDRQFAK